MEFVPGSRWEPFRFEVAGFSRTQPVRRAIQFGFEVIRSGIRIFSQGSCSIIVQSQLRTVGAKNDGRLSRIFFAFLVLKAYERRVAAKADGALKLDSCLRIRRAGKFDLALLSFRNFSKGELPIVD